MFSYYAATVPQPSSTVTKEDIPEQEPELASTRAPRRGHLVVAGRYTNTKKLESEVDVARTVLGDGMSAEVKLSKHRASGRQFAVKSLSKLDLEDGRLDELRMEVQTHLTLDHPAIARLEQVYESESDIHMVIEYLPGQELFDKIVQCGRFTQFEAASAMKQMLSAVQYMHGHGLVHRDLKPENFIYEEKKSTKLKMIDFGFARQFNSEKDEAMTHVCGTLYYMAPEVLGGSPYTEKADMWSMGVILYTMLCGGVPWDHDDDKTMEMVAAGTPAYDAIRFGRLPAQLKKLIKSLLSKDPAQRPSATGALNHPWFAAAGVVHPRPHMDSTIARILQDFRKASPLQRVCATMAAWSTSSEEQKCMRDHFMAIGSDSNGALTLRQFTQAMKSVEVEAAEAEDIFRSIDFDGDGEIAFSEFAAGAILPKALAVDTLRLTFGRFDVDGDGEITAKDLKEVLGKCFKKYKVGESLLTVGASDGTINFEEFLSLMSHMSAGESDTDVAARVQARRASSTSLLGADTENSGQKQKSSDKTASRLSAKTLLGIN